MACTRRSAAPPAGDARRWTDQKGLLVNKPRPYEDDHAADVYSPPGNHLHWLEGDRKGQHAISVNDQWRICFRFEDGDAYDVEICDYH